MHAFFKKSLAALAIGVAASLLPDPAAAQYHSGYGGNCERPLVAWRGARGTCDGYGPARAHHGHGGHRGGHHGGGGVRIIVGPPLYLGTVVVPRGQLLVPRGGGPTIFIPR